MTQDERNDLVAAMLFSLKQEGFGHEHKCEATVSLSIGGFPWSLTVRGQSHPDLMDALPQLSTALEALGCKPPLAAPVAAGGGNGGALTTERPPVCPDHGKPMRLSNNGKLWYCPTPMGTEDDPEKPGAQRKTWCQKKIRVGEV